ncbi:MAG: ParB N-terminal domain-containing protein [bacterium]|nr:ParB N-terminal domain-containing protein [bacterium]
MRLIKDLIPPDVIVRPVDMNGIDFELLCDSITKKGLLVPITVCGDKIADGYRRWLACKSLGWKEIPVHEVEGDATEVRIITQTRETPFNRDEKRAFLGTYLSQNREATAAQVAHTYQWNLAEVESLAGLEYVIGPFVQAYRSGDITLATLWQLSRCRDGTQLELLESDGDLYEEASAVHRECRAARRRQMVTRPRIRGYSAIRKELENPAEAGLALIKSDAKTPLDGWLACLRWIVATD